MKLVKKSITIPEELILLSNQVSDNFSALVTKALEEYLKKEKIKKAISAFGSWEESRNNSIEIVNDLRKDRKI
ncbi:MAG: hypothetical protein ACMUJM_24835 [bacterium]